MGSVSGTVVGINSPVPFSSTNFISTPPGTRLTMSGSSIVVNDTGFYQVTFGVSNSTNTLAGGEGPASVFSLAVNGTTSPFNTLTTTNSDNNYGTYRAIVVGMCTATAIINITQSGSTISLINETGVSITLNDTSLSGIGPCAYIVIVKLQ